MGFENFNKATPEESALSEKQMTQDLTPEEVVNRNALERQRKLAAQGIEADLNELIREQEEYKDLSKKSIDGLSPDEAKRLKELSEKGCL